MAEVYLSTQPPAKKRNWKLIGGIVAGTLVLMCACVGGLASYGGRIQARQTATAQALGVVNQESTVGTSAAIVMADAPTPTAALVPTDTPEPTEAPEPTPTVADVAARPTTVPTPASDAAALLPPAATSTTAPVGAAPTATPDGLTLTVTSSANVRDIPSANASTVVGQASAGDVVAIRGKVSDDSWYAVTLPGGLEGWMSATLVTVDAGTAAAAAVLATPIPVAVVPTTAPAVAAPAPAAPVPAESSGVNTAGRDLYNCGDFATWAEANAVYQANLPGDPNKLDANDDGLPCDSLR